ncbi:MAG: hypothetical protein LC624_09380, partial [Halobacteriales archaeon]|nr:hypothetical protein [Halobacteriales archaeon]
MLKALLGALLLALPLPLPVVVGELHGHAPGDAADLALRVLHAGGLDVAPPAPVGEAQGLRQELLAWDALHGRLPAGDGLAALDAQLAQLPPDVQAPVARIVHAMTLASVMRDHAFARVGADELAWARGASLNLDLLRPDQAARLAGILARIDRPLVMQAGLLVLGTVQAQVPVLRDA